MSFKPTPLQFITKSTYGKKASKWWLCFIISAGHRALQKIITHTIPNHNLSAGIMEKGLGDAFIFDHPPCFFWLRLNVCVLVMICGNYCTCSRFYLAVITSLTTLYPFCDLYIYAGAFYFTLWVREAAGTDRKLEKLELFHRKKIRSEVFFCKSKEFSLLSFKIYGSR